MRELVFSVGITFLTGTLLFVYFRNKMNRIDRKVNMVFDTIQEHNSRIQSEAEEEMKRFQMYHQQQMQMNQMSGNMDSHEQHNVVSDENIENFTNQPTTLIDVSDKESEFSDESDDDSDESDSDDDINDTNENNDELKSNTNTIEELLTNTIEEISVTHNDPEKNTQINNNSENNDDDEPSDGLLIMEDKLDIKKVEPLVNYNKYTKAQLRNICEERGLTGWKSLNKGKLVTFLENQ